MILLGEVIETIIKKFSNNIIRDSNWERYDNSLNVTEKWEICENIIREHIDNMCPLKTFRIKAEKRTLDHQ